MNPLNRLGSISHTRVLEFQVQNYNLYIVKNENPLRQVETNYMYFLTHLELTVGGLVVEEVKDFFQTVIPDQLWDYVLISHMNFIYEADQMFLEYLLQEINQLIA